MIASKEKKITHYTYFNQNRDTLLNFSHLGSVDPILSYPILSYPILSYPILSYINNTCQLYVIKLYQLLCRFKFIMTRVKHCYV